MQIAQIAATPMVADDTPARGRTADDAASGGGFEEVFAGSPKPHEHSGPHRDGAGTTRARAGSEPRQASTASDGPPGPRTGRARAADTAGVSDGEADSAPVPEAGRETLFATPEESAETPTTSEAAAVANTAEGPRMPGALAFADAKVGTEITEKSATDDAEAPDPMSAPRAAPVPVDAATPGAGETIVAVGVGGAEAGAVARAGAQPISSSPLIASASSENTASGLQAGPGRAGEMAETHAADLVRGAAARAETAAAPLPGATAATPAGPQGQGPEAPPAAGPLPPVRDEQMAVAPTGRAGGTPEMQAPAQDTALVVAEPRTERAGSDRAADLTTAPAHTAGRSETALPVAPITPPMPSGKGVDPWTISTGGVATPDAVGATEGVFGPEPGATDPFLADVRGAMRSSAASLHPVFLAPETPRNVTLQILEVLRATGERAIELRLHPEELGRVQMTMSQDATGSLTVSLNVERAETLDLLRRNIDMLGAELRELGYGSVDFSFQGDGTGDGSKEQPEAKSIAAGGRGATDPETGGTGEDEALRVLMAQGTVDGGIDIRL